MGSQRRWAIPRKIGRVLRLLGSVWLCLGIICYGSLAGAQTPEAATAAPATPTSGDRPLVVGLSPVPPFVIESSSAQGGSDWDGIGVQLWQEVAHELNLDYQWRKVQPNAAIAQINNGEIDVALVTATASREQQVDFTQSYFAATLGIATLRQQQVWNVVKAVLSPRFLKICLWLSLVLIVVGFICWLLEHRSNEGMFNKSPRQGIWDGFWWAGVTMTTIGYGDKAPR
ncbi:MAG: transporter substrate-binding domain-containing protein, partial [Nodosilinea sp.]